MGIMGIVGVISIMGIVGIMVIMGVSRPTTSGRVHQHAKEQRRMEDVCSNARARHRAAKNGVCVQQATVSSEARASVGVCWFTGKQLTAAGRSDAVARSR